MRATRTLLSFGSLALWLSPVHAHIGSPHGTALQWNFDPVVLVPLIVSVWLYGQGVRRLWAKAGLGRGVGFAQAAAFGLGWCVLVVALVSPLDDFGSRSLWGHMVQHELLMIVAAPLLVLGRPLEAWAWGLAPRGRRACGRIARIPWLRAAWTAITAPAIAWGTHALAIWVWHAPVFFQAALASEAVHTFQHLSFLLSGLLFWWAVCGHLRRLKSHAIAAALLFTTMLHTGALGALMMFSTHLWYPAYALRAAEFGFSPFDDQALAGLIMWVPGGLAYIVAALWIAGRSLACLAREHATAEGALRHSD